MVLINALNDVRAKQAQRASEGQAPKPVHVGGFERVLERRASLNEGFDMHDDMCNFSIDIDQY